ncbi:actin-like ATPase domain-containing protein [Pseudovirgaria hyperparasitica]|uniref:Phosphotransferase n=1 Tax=Pseudovirgaria hyperparasitica TaxID=470096 RepID=A0A6A6WEZ5_9PEZI|nr:actin-like ATPase domain-containing protein [Pseudovirgaria hyperparasitica]KAF2761392.1 actin-like ATPase domain-containing protein [Pseudovirgaria hyperparasitica]
MPPLLHIPTSVIELWQALMSLLDSYIIMPTLSEVLSPTRLRLRKRARDVVPHSQRNMHDFLFDVKSTFEAPLSLDSLLAMSTQLQDEFRQKLQSSTECMLPSFSHTLPTGDERGTFLALDVGGTNFRVALVELNGKDSTTSGMWMSKMRSFRIDNAVRSLPGAAFFDWMAEKIQEVLSQSDIQNTAVLSMGLSWSFPIAQTSQKTGTILPMGKGFRASDGLIGKDLSLQLMEACRSKDLNVRVEAIINDSSATLLTRAFADNATRIALILGTGFNASAHLPVNLFSQEKFGSRPETWHEKAENVLVNTELSMFGKTVFPLTKWDEQIKKNHPKPDYQPFEHLIAGRYLGEITRLILLDAIKTAGLFGGEIPGNFSEEHSFDTAIMAAFESDETKHLSTASAAFLAAHPLKWTPSHSELHMIRQICSLVTHRAAAFLATGTHALWYLRTTAEGLNPAKSGRISIGCNGSVIERYPSFKTVCQTYLDDLTTMSGAQPNSVMLEPAVESAIFGAAVAASCED